MDEAVLRYKERRQKRLDAKIIDRYRVRRDARKILRLDADEENNAPKKGGHGNTKIPFGLCQREGIKIDPSWGPKDAWDALAGKGYSAGEVYKELKSTGKVEKRTERVNRKTGEVEFKKYKKPTKIEEGHFESAFMGRSHKKNTMEVAKYLNEHCKDGDVTEFLSMATGTGAKRYPNLAIKKSSDGEGCQVSPTWFRSTGDPRGMGITIPLLSRAATPEQKAAAVRSFVHEYTHYLDYLARDEVRKHVPRSGTNKELNDALKANDGMQYSDEVKELFRQYDAGYNELIEKRNSALKNVRHEVAQKMFGDDKPAWMSAAGTVDRFARGGMSDEANAYISAVKKAEKEIKENSSKDRRAYMDGLVCLQGIYDALSMGRLRESRQVKYGHSTAYYRRDAENQGMEAFADYVALRATRPDLVDVFKRDKPEIAAAMDRQIEDMIKRLRGG